MSILAVVANLDQAGPMVGWGLTFSALKHQPLTILCWSYSPTIEYPLLADDDHMAASDALVQETQRVLDEIAEDKKSILGTHSVKIVRAIHPDVVASSLTEIRAANHDLLVVASTDSSGEADGGGISGSLLRRSPCETIVLSRAGKYSSGRKRVLIASVDSPHDQAAFELFACADKSVPLKITLARLEDDAGPEAVELGRREVKRMLRDAGVKVSQRIKRRVYTSDQQSEFITAANQQDVVFVGASQPELILQLHQSTSRPTIGVIKRSPPLKRFGRMSESRWLTKLNPADYAEMMHGLRRGAVLNSDFLIMLGLAAAIATLGLIQDSAAVVIGSMLLAPLMTPMIAFGLAIAQGNKKLGRRSMLAIGGGFLLTLGVSYLLALLTPGEELTAQIISRGNPNILDLLIALFSAAAAAYALARPSLVGAVAGVAIATALVPPLCSTGISLAYREFLNAQGAALLFVTNLVAIVLGAGLMFRMLGVTYMKAGAAQRRWVYRAAAVIGTSLIVLAIPLQFGLQKLIEQGKSQPTNYPLTKIVEHSLVEYIERTPGVQLVASGRPSTLHSESDVVIVLSSPKRLRPEYAAQLIEICRREMGDPDLVVEVHCFLDAWQQETDPSPEEQIFRAPKLDPDDLE